MKKMIVLFLLVVLTVSSVLGTAQIPDQIIYKGQNYKLHTNPMEGYFEKHPKQRPKGYSTALWRGYKAIFEVKDKNLFLKDIQIEQFNKKTNKTEWQSFSERIAPTGTILKIDWFSGILVMPYGDRVHYLHQGYASTYAKYILLEVAKGKITGARNYTLDEYNKFKAKQFEAYQKTADYKKKFDECSQKLLKLNDKPMPKTHIDSFLKMYVIDYTSKFLDNPKVK